MSDWGDAYEEQQKSERDQGFVGLSSKMAARLSISGSGDLADSGIQRGTLAGDAPPPQTSFGSTTQGVGRGFGFNAQRGRVFPPSGKRGAEAAPSNTMLNNTANQLRQHQQNSGMHPGVSAFGFTGADPSVNPQPPQLFPNRTYVSPDILKKKAELRKPVAEAEEESDEVDKPMTAEEVALLNKFLHKTVQKMNGTVDVSKQQNDPKSPLHSILGFRDFRIREELIKALDLMGFYQPSKIQEFALPLLLMEPRTNLIAQSQSGTGKTAAFVLTMLSRVVVEDRWPQCLCLAPTYELAMQIGEVLSKMAKFMPDVKVHYAVKGSKPTRGTILTEQIVIGTPGKVIDYLTKLRCLDPSKIGVLVLDEADVMISQHGHLDLSYRIYNAIEQASPRVQSMLFSATYEKDVMEFAENIVKDAVSVTLKREEQSLPNIKQYYVECGSRDAKYKAVCYLYSGLIIASAVIFTHTRSSATWLAQRMKEKGHEVVLLHGDLTVQERALAIEQFRDGVYKVLITTNVCARGIDVSQVSIVINYDAPVIFDRPNDPDYDTYLHRIGRTGRFGKAGIAINFVDSQASLNIVKQIETYFGKPIIKLDPSDIDQLEAVERD